MAESKPPITCHVLDTTVGRPAANIPVSLTLHNPPESSSSGGDGKLVWKGETNGDGRVTSWTPSTPFSSASLASVFPQPGDHKYTLTFDTDSYFSARGIKTFYPEVEVKFVVREDGYGDERGGGKGQHYHVPVLLGPFGYTTYRGS